MLKEGSHNNIFILIFAEILSSILLMVTKDLIATT